MMTIGEQSSEPSLNVILTLYHFRQVYKTSQGRGKLKDGGGPVVSPSLQKKHKHIFMQWKERRGKKAVLTVLVNKNNFSQYSPKRTYICSSYNTFL